MSDLFKIKLSTILASSQFWWPTIILYYQWQGIPTEQIYLMLAIYSVCALIFEYPTGVVADYFSPRISLIIGYFIMTTTFFLQTFHLPLVYYISFFMINAAAYTLTSGSNTALLHSVSTNFKHDFAQVKMYSLMMTVLSTIVGGLTIAFDLRWSLYLSGFCFFLSGILLLLSKPHPYTRISGNIFKGGLIGLQHVRANTQLLYLLLIASLISGFFMSFKFFYTPLFSAMKLDEPSWGFYIALGVLSSALGVHLFKKYSDWNTRLLLMLFLGSFLLIGLVTHPMIALVGLFIAYFFRGYLETKLGVAINEAISSHARASILSLESFLTRIVSTLFTLVLGLLTAQVSFSLLMIGSAIFLLLVGSYPLLRLKKV